MERLSTKPPPKVTLRIERGPVTPVARQVWIKFWWKLISECKHEAGSEVERE